MAVASAAVEGLDPLLIQQDIGPKPSADYFSLSHVQCPGLLDAPRTPDLAP